MPHYGVTMFRTTVAYLMRHLQTLLFDGRPKSVIFGEGDRYFQRQGENRLETPGIAISLSQMSLRHGPAIPTQFKAYDNASGTKTITLNCRPITMTFSAVYYTHDMLQSFEFLQRYYELQNRCVVPVRYYIKDDMPIEIECAGHHFEDPTVAPDANARSQSFDSAGLIYTMDCGFSFDTVYLESEEHKMIRVLYRDIYLGRDEATGVLYSHTEVSK